MDLVRRPFQRSLRFHVKTEKTLQVTCSLHTSLEEVERVLTKHQLWIQKQIQECKNLKRKHPPKKFRQGEVFLFRGKRLKLKYVFLKDCERAEGKSPKFHREENSLIYFWSCGEDLNRESLKKGLRIFYETAGRKFLEESLRTHSARMGLVPRSVRIGSQKSLWGSCSGQGTISLNWKLVTFPPAVLDYVVIHELAHLKHLNHSAAFWALTARFCPQYREQERRLKKDRAYAVDFLTPRYELRYN